MGDVRTEHFTKLTKEQWQINMRTLKKIAVLYIHGKGGSATEADYYNALFPEYDVYGLSYNASTPWEAKEEIQSEIHLLDRNYDRIILIANSIGAFFSMNAKIETAIKKAYFISPIVNMEKLIEDMMMWANVSEQELREKQTIETDFGETLSWEYLSYVRNNPILWNVPTDILYGSQDQLTSLETITSFTRKHNARLTVMENGEHWFHTKEQMDFLNKWIRNEIDVSCYEAFT